MSRRTTRYVFGMMVFLYACSGLPAQEATTKGQNPTPPSSTSATRAGTDKSTPTDQKDSSAATPAPKPKKVWTNDDMKELHENSTVSVVGTQKKHTASNNYGSPPPGQSEYLVKMYRQQIDQLQAQVDAIDKQIADLRDAESGKTVDSSRTYDPWGGKTGDWNAQIAQLQRSRDDVLKQIDSIEEQIRKVNP
jgi:uncharacterized protein YukE